MSDIISQLPEDIQRKIYTDHFETTLIYDEIQTILNSPESMHLEYIPLSEKILYIFSKPLLVKYLLKYDPIFCLLLDTHVIQKKKSFKLLSPIHSFALAWLMYLYH